MSAGGLNKLPFGNIPRLLLAWVCTEAVRTQSRELILGPSLSEFMRKLGMVSVGGARTRLRNQMDRLFNAYVSLIYEDKHGKATVNSQVADRTELWWNHKRPNEPSLWQSKIYLGEAFFNEIIQHPVPLDMNILKALKRSSLGIGSLPVAGLPHFRAQAGRYGSPWPRLYRQFGVDPTKANDNLTVQNFRKECLRELKKIKIAWPGLNYSTAKGVLILSPSTPTIPPVRQLSLVE